MTFELCFAWYIDDNLPVASDLSRAMNDAVIRRLAGDRSYQRGLDYYLHGHVESLEEHADGIRAVVRGSDDYKVELSSDDGIVDHSCECPYASGGVFCKHCVATALAWLDRLTRPAKIKRRANVKKITLADARKILLAEKKEDVVASLLEWAKTDERLGERLILYAARRSGAEASVAAVEKVFQKAVETGGFVYYREMASYARGVNEAIDSIEQLRRDGQPGAVVELCESALGSLIGAMEQTDDSDGYMGDLRDRLQDIHYKACKEGKPEPVALAGRLFHWELHGEFDLFYGAISRYGKILGAEGLEAYRRLAAAEWRKVPERTANDQSHAWRKDFQITHIMERLALLSGDTKALVAVMSRDLSHAYNYLKIAEVCRDAKQHDMALEWAEKGLAAFPERTDGRLREFAANQYHRRRRHDEAMKLIWAEYAEQPGLERYRSLQRHAKKAGNWTDWRERALAEIRRRIEAAPQERYNPVRPPWMPSANDHSLLVEIFLHERDVEAAWREAQAGGCSHTLWLRLAAARERDHPEDVVPIYFKQAEVEVRTARKSVYDHAVVLLEKAATLMKRIGRSQEFVEQMEALRQKYKIKRNFVKRLDQRSKWLYLQ